MEDDLNTLNAKSSEIADNKFSMVIDTLINIAIAVVVFAVVYFFVAQPHQVDGSSMLPNFVNNDYVLTEKITQHFDGYNKGEAIVFHYPNDTTKDYIKRIIALPGDEVMIENGKVYINDVVLDETYTDGSETRGNRFLGTGDRYRLGDNEYFVLGDNRDESSDSREWGPVDKSLIVGKVFFRYWPISSFGMIRSK